MPEIKIIDAKEYHLKDLASIENECFSMPWTENQLKSQFTDDNHIFIVAEDENNKVAGYVSAMIVVDEADINNVAVSSKYRRQGIADRLINELTKMAEKRNLVLITLEVRQSNEPARKLYLKHGFEEVGVRRNYYLKPREDAILMTYKFE